MSAVCNKCGILKSASEMGRNRGKSNGLHHWCLACRRVDNNLRNRNRTQNHRSDMYRKQRYGLTPIEYQSMFAAQGGACAICSQRAADCVDHCHNTGKVRGLLCKGCNTLLKAIDNWAHLESARAYLAKPAFEARDAGYGEPQPLHPEDEAAQLQREFISAVKGLEALQARMTQNARLQAVG